ncbi:serine threonine protein kinase : Serine/threonine protein kinase OS=Singulisphaera acidiphila (strain ATCC BAA-1392 / DSM 18658 / VKM B-2454 / MOB10) GN=Sinac_6649 PE=3 SV=1: Pkinase: TPR_2: TPR_11: TPR_9 [Gemmata massiliana]|uniref:Protein kinase domain-containing protein n=1 Tax=Gemmata massiliana TaxID=1210884 RepID=A0A6P2D411_9BACT|nr:protein kinase [Gemmata massiliana]VTR95823.1 serine threonine protein kinase : Serine/threonine protein kinase OS=Singulisphaera acidiphila (strain ATCC BAA-1392 / DSM 18658 / VKM B-2454 / MOB10) GN=Sinac_6649 PE=3 SV=1: Pkinase: TPR_2: TPR_11: TPR_9 [Gemmata massiliana]
MPRSTQARKHPDSAFAFAEEVCTDHMSAPPPALTPHDATDCVCFVGHEPDSGSSVELSGLLSDDPYPRIGSHLLHFEIVEELGRGAFARVYLARQESLANRLVALKVTLVWTAEPQTLAKLRHTNIIPVYSVHEAGRFQVVCMPFLGRHTLARVLADLPDGAPASARALFNQLPAAHEHELNHATYADGCLWVIGQLAAGLTHAHRAGTLHRDLKPGNVLLTDDGTPMILDFNVATSTDGTDEAASSVGGTFPYMAPEHLRAFAGESAVVDARSDLFSLGVMLYQMLTQELPFPHVSLPNKQDTVRRQIAVQEQPPVPVRERNPAVSSAIAAIVAKLLDPEPARRYQSAADLREDIARHLAHLPLRFAPESSFRERARKWRRRNPRPATALMVTAAALVLFVLPASVAAVRQTQIATRTKEVQRAEALVASDAAVSQLHTAAVELGSRTDPALRDRGLADARNVVARYAVADDPAWDQRPQFVLLDAARRVELKKALAEMLVLMTRVEAEAGGYSREAIEAGLRWNTAADRLFAPEDRPGVLDRHRAELEARRNGRPVPPFRPAPVTARDADLQFDGLDLAATDRYREALPLLARFCDRNPTHFRAWFARGMCHDALGQPADAATAFSVCLALVPDFPLALANRGIARLKQKRFQEAEADFTRALELKPDWVVVLVNRGLAREGMKQYKGAEADFTSALADPASPARVLFLRSRVRHADNNPAGASADRAAGLKREPNDPLSWATRGRHRMAKEPLGSLADFDAALKLAPAMREALLDKAIVLADHLHREAEAIPLLDRLLDLYPDHTEGRAGRGVYLARLGRAPEARADAIAILAAEPTAYRKYQAAGLHAQLAKHAPRGPDRAEALRLLALALRAGFDDMKLLATDTDLDPIRTDPEFQRLVRAVSYIIPGTPK